MIRKIFLVFALVFAACGGTAVAPDNGATEAASELWTCGMHPEVIREEPGTCPICGMDLTPMGATGGRDGSNVVSIDPTVVQNMGVRLGRARHQTLFKHLRTIGEVEVGEDELSVVNLRYSGWIERVFVERTGDPVERGQALFSIYSPELVAAQEELLLAVRTQGADSPLARSARTKLRNWEISDRDIDAVITEGAARREVVVRAPGNGFVLHKDVVEGTRVPAGRDLYRIGDLTRIWVTAELYEFDAPWVEVGQAAQMELSYQLGEVIQGRVAYIYPTLNPASRTLPVRLEFDNPGIKLKPGMFATVSIEYRRRDNTLAIPSEAILRSGKRELVFVSLGEGRFEPRAVRTGLVGDRHLTEILDGLMEGELIVTSGQFLIDSESQLQEAVQKMMARREGQQVSDPAPTTVWSCPMHPEILADGPDRCPRCGMDLVEREGTAQELHKVHGEHAGHVHEPGQPAAPGQYTCPMHPDVVSDDPGACPRCGMFLEQVPEPGATP